MPTVFRTVPTALAGVLLLAACGSESLSEAPAGTEVSCPSELRQGSRPSGSPTPIPLPSLDGPGENGVKVTGLYACGAEFSAEFEVTNQANEAATFTVTLGFRSASAGRVDDVEQIVASVGPGRTVKKTVGMGESLGRGADVSGVESDVSGVEVVKVRSVPVDEASSASGPCPASGLHVYADDGDAALGLRVVGLHLVNCGTGPYELDGYPELEILDEDHDNVDSVRILHGTDRISTGVGGDGGPQPVVLRPGEAAQTTLAWRNTTQFGEPVNAPYVRVRAKQGARPVMVVPELDLGTTGKLGVGPWQKDETYRDPAAAGTPRP
ncbi:DUF4232 domain-containing protein [Streptomyces cyaneochromogenes]|uniref:DUF4232 domain-containing protein n=1 Tax=Streptomyces cyaneochromogenes TaxID=2496836 RepID=A0A3S9M7H9_9ACTN|nr:DUF4232 domain-containing protein [Streptomyces cyaneochromogenes]AZQ35135.1 DUF4232 domain-containing protein [Streptomyces cyaneochromogenes]